MHFLHFLKQFLCLGPRNNVLFPFWCWSHFPNWLECISNRDFHWQRSGGSSCSCWAAARHQLFAARHVGNNGLLHGGHCWRHNFSCPLWKNLWFASIRDNRKGHSFNDNNRLHSPLHWSSN